MVTIIQMEHGGHRNGTRNGAVDENIDNYYTQHADRTGNLLLLVGKRARWIGASWKVL
jgi:hypothetical protein